MEVSLVFATFLCFTTWKSCDHEAYLECCLSYSLHKIPIQQIKGFSVQRKGLCPINAIVFHTSRNRICADPSSDWVIAAMKVLDERVRQSGLQNRENGQNDKGATSDITPAPAITSTTRKSSIHEAYLECCRSYYLLKIPIRHIKGYKVQTRGLCQINAIVFYTTRRKRICTDPSSPWVKAAMQTLYEKVRQSGLQNRENRQNDEGATSDITTATATTSTYTTQRFHTKTGGTICSDQNSDCAKEDVLKEDEEDRKHTLQENGQNNEGATSDMTPATATTSTYTTQRENGQNDEGATSDITSTTATTSKLHLTEKPKVQWENGPKTFCLRSHNTSHSYHRQQTLFFTVVLLLLYCINSKHMWN